MNYLLSAIVARRLGIKTQTLAKWRMEGKGPKGWIYLSATRCAYSEEAVDVFVEELASRKPEFNFRKATGAPKIVEAGRVME